MADRYVALIRGINVGRAKRVAMADLRGLLVELGCTDVVTILNSGNVVFGAPRQQPSRLAQRIEKAMTEKLGVSGRVTVLTASEFEDVVDGNALVGVAGDPARHLVAFCNDSSRLKQLGAAGRQDWAPEALAVGSLAAYLWCADGILASRLLEAVGRALGDSTTTRNWATVGKVHAALQLGSSTAVKSARRARTPRRP